MKINYEHCDKITIYSDPKSRIHGIFTYNNTHPIITLLKDTINKGHKEYNFCLIPGHKGLNDNEAADRAAVEVTIEGEEIEIAVSRQNYRAIIKRKINRGWEEE